MTPVKFFKETALPAALEPHSFYLILPTANPDHVEAYLTRADGSAVPLVHRAQVQSMIDASVRGGNSVEMVDDIAARDALALTENTMVLVFDASGDVTVNTGAALYAYRQADASFTKIAEFESIDVSVDWDSILNRPASAADQIDAAVSMRHSHTNKSQIDKVGEDSDGNLTYGGSLPVIGWETEGW